MKIAVVGAGFSGAVIARELAKHGHTVDVFEARDHVAGNCHTETDNATGVLVHKYGPHIFHTNNERVWLYVKQFANMMPYEHHSMATVRGKVYALPINLHTINQFFGTCMSPITARNYINDLHPWISTPQNFEEAGVNALGRELYEAFFQGYTAKQWGRDPKSLPVSVFARLPLRFNYDSRYFNHPYQAQPRDGYTALVSAILDIPQCHVHLRTPFIPERAAKYAHTFYSGPLDAWFHHCHGRLPYRTLDFAVERYSCDDAQGCAVMNYPDKDTPWTRVTEHKHFRPWIKTTGTVLYRETSREAGPLDIPYYPIRLADEQEMLAEYEKLARSQRHVTFVGRLGTYRYLDMDVTIAEALDAVDKFLGFR